MEKILIVDDSLLQATQLKAIIEDEYAVTIAQTAEDGLRRAHDEDFSLILLDVVMPEMDGFTLLKILQEEIITQSVPVILITSLSDVENEQRGLVLGAVGYITKPYIPLIVKARVNTHVKLYRYRRQIEEQSMTDQLTGVANRHRYDRYSLAKWHEAARLQIPFSICMFDIDHFKMYNDTFGHPAGDKVIAVVAKTISSAWTVTINPHKANLRSGTFIDDLSIIGPQCPVGHTSGLYLENGVDARSTSADSTATVTAKVLTKIAPVYDYASGRMKWAVEVDAAGLSMADVVLTDDLPAGLTYVKDSLTTTPAITDAEASTDGQMLTIRLGAVTGKTTVTFETEVDPEILGFGGDQPVVVENTIRMNGKADGVEFAEVSHRVEQNFSNHGLVKKSDVDNTQELIQYEVLINPYRLALPGNPSLVDTLDKRLQLNPDTLLFYKAALAGTTGDPGSPVDPSDPSSLDIGSVTTGDPNIPQTGDHTRLLVLVTLLSGIALAAMTLYRFLGQKKREKE